MKKSAAYQKENYTETKRLKNEKNAKRVAEFKKRKKDLGLVRKEVFVTKATNELIKKGAKRIDID